MLILSRHRDESIIIGDEITITVVDLMGDKARLGISAPIETPVHRLEIYERVRHENGGLPLMPQCTDSLDLANRIVEVARLREAMRELVLLTTGSLFNQSEHAAAVIGRARELVVNGGNPR